MTRLEELGVQSLPEGEEWSEEEEDEVSSPSMETIYLSKLIIRYTHMQEKMWSQVASTLVVQRTNLSNDELM